MSPHPAARLLGSLALAALPGTLSAAPASATSPRQTTGVLTTVNGQVRDLSVDAAGRLLYCTEQGEIGRIVPATGMATVLAGTVNGLPSMLRGVVETPAGDVVAVHAGGDLLLLPGGAPPVTLIYMDRFMIADASDLIVDVTGTFVVCSKTPSSNTRGINWIDSSGNPNTARWAYFLVQHQPLSLAVDPLTSDLLLADAGGMGALRLIDVHDETRPTSVVAGTTNFAFSTVEGDGDIAFDVSGNAYVVSGGVVHRYNAGTGLTSPWMVGFGQLRGAVISASSPNVMSPTGWSLYLAEDEAPTKIVEIGGVGAPAALEAPDLGTVPNQGTKIVTFSQFRGLRAYELAVDHLGRLLLGGDLFGANEQIRRIDPDTLVSTTVADQTNGLAGRIEGLTVGTDGTIHALTTNGFVHEIHEGPLSVTTVYTDPQGHVVAGKDMTRDRDGTHFIADREGFGPGEVVQLSSAWAASSLVQANDARGVTPDPFSAGLLVTEWNCMGFCGSIDRYDFGSGLLDPIPGLATMNYTNDFVWGDGDSTLDVEGNVYTCSEDDWRLTRYDPAKQRFSSVGSMYLNHPSGVVITRSTPGSGSTTGWSLYVSEFDFLWEIPSVPPPAPRLLDRNAPPVGELLGWFRRTLGTPRAMIPDPAGDGLLVTSSTGSLQRVAVSTGQVTTLLMPPGGTDFTAMTALANGHVVVASSTGLIFDLNPATGYTATLIFSDPAGQLFGVRGMTADAQGRLLIVDRNGASPASRLYRLSGGTLQLLTHTSRGLRPAIDPLTGDVFVTERGSVGDGSGEILRVEAFSSPVSHGHWRGSAFTTFEMGEADGGIVFDASGNFYVTEGELGRVVRIDRATGARSVVAGNYDQPLALALAPGRPGIAGAQGTSLFVLDGWAVYEVGVNGLPAPPPPASNPGLAPPADLRVTGSVVLSSNVPIRIESPANAGRLYLLIPTISGKLPGVPLSVLGTPDPRVLPSNPDMLWNLIGDPLFMPASISVLDNNGKSPAALSVFIGPSPTVYNLNLFLDLVWIAIDTSAPNRVGLVGGTAQLFLGN